MQDNVTYFRLATLIQALKVHLRTGGKMRLTRTATPTAMLKMASEFTGKTYKRGDYAVALEDLGVVKENLLWEASN